MKRTLSIAGLALLGIAVAIGLSLTTSRLSGQTIGISDEPPSAGSELAQPRTTSTSAPTRTATSPRTATTPPQTTSTPSSTGEQTSDDRGEGDKSADSSRSGSSGSGSNSGSGSDDSGRGRGGDD